MRALGVRYLKSTSELHLILRYDGLSLSRWHVDASYAVHPDFRSHSGGVCFLSGKGGGIASGSMKQKLNVRSSTEAKMVSVDDFLSKILWVSRFMEAQGVSLKNELHQDNKSSILLCTKGRGSLGKRSRAMNVRYFTIKDHVDRGEIRIIHCGTERMVGDFFTKPLQGSRFYAFRDLILGYSGFESESQTPKIPCGPDSAAEGTPKSISNPESAIKNSEKPLRKSTSRPPTQKPSRR